MHKIPKDVLDKTMALGIVPGATVKWDTYAEFIVPPYDDWLNNSVGWFCPSKQAGHAWGWITHPIMPKVIRTAPGHSIKYHDDVIRVGDMVTQDGWSKYYKVHSVDGEEIKLKSALGGMFSYSINEKFIKQKAGGPIPTTNNQPTHGTVLVEFEGKGDYCGNGRAVRGGSSAGRTATGKRFAGHPQGAAIGRGRIVSSKVRPTAVRSSHL